MPLIMVITFIPTYYFHLILFSQRARNLGTTLAIAFNRGRQWDLFYPLLLLVCQRNFLKLNIFEEIIGDLLDYGTVLKWNCLC